jgi:hypothetical protein
MARRGYNVIVDDNPDTLKGASSEGYDAIRFRRPWNETLESPKGDGTVLTFLWGSWKNEWSASGWYSVLDIVRNITDRSEHVPNEEKGDPSDRIIPPYPSDFPNLAELGDLDTDDAVIVNDKGAKQSDLKARFDLLPARALAEVAKVLQKGAAKYGEENWRGLSVAEIHNHTLGHAVNFNETDDLEDLSHTACRALMALEIYLGGGTDGDSG